MLPEVSCVICYEEKLKEQKKTPNYFLLLPISIESSLLSHGHVLESGEETHLVTRNIKQHLIFLSLIYMLLG